MVLNSRENLCIIISSLLTSFRGKGGNIDDETCLIFWKHLDMLIKTHFKDVTFDELVKLIVDSSAAFKLMDGTFQYIPRDIEELNKFYVEEFNEFQDWKNNHKEEK